MEMGRVEEVLDHPRHPYTRLLFESVPQPDPEQRFTERITLLEEEGEYLKGNCKFSERCPGVLEVCAERVPEEIELARVLVKCHKYTREVKRE